MFDDLVLNSYSNSGNSSSSSKKDGKAEFDGIQLKQKQKQAAAAAIAALAKLASTPVAFAMHRDEKSSGGNESMRTNK